QVGQDAVQAAARVGGGDAEDLGDLRVGEPGVELQGQQLAVAAGQGGDRVGDGAAAELGLVAPGDVLGRTGPVVGQVVGEGRTALAAAELVDRRVAGDAEEPRAGV